MPISALPNVVRKRRSRKADLSVRKLIRNFQRLSQPNYSVDDDRGTDDSTQSPVTIPSQPRPPDPPDDPPAPAAAVRYPVNTDYGLVMPRDARSLVDKAPPTHIPVNRDDRRKMSNYVSRQRKNRIQQQEKNRHYWDYKDYQEKTPPQPPTPQPPIPQPPTPQPPIPQPPTPQPPTPQPPTPQPAPIPPVEYNEEVARTQGAIRKRPPRKDPREEDEIINNNSNQGPPPPPPPAVAEVQQVSPDQTGVRGDKRKMLRDPFEGGDKPASKKPDYYYPPLPNTDVKMKKALPPIRSGETASGYHERLMRSIDNKPIAETGGDEMEEDEFKAPTLTFKGEKEKSKSPSSLFLPSRLKMIEPYEEIRDVEQMPSPPDSENEQEMEASSDQNPPPPPPQPPAEAVMLSPSQPPAEAVMSSPSQPPAEAVMSSPPQPPPEAVMSSPQSENLVEMEEEVEEDPVPVYPPVAAIKEIVTDLEKRLDPSQEEYRPTAGDDIKEAIQSIQRDRASKRPLAIVPPTDNRSKAAKPVEPILPRPRPPPPARPPPLAPPARPPPLAPPAKPPPPPPRPPPTPVVDIRPKSPPPVVQEPKEQPKTEDLSAKEEQNAGDDDDANNTDSATERELSAKVEQLKADGRKDKRSTHMSEHAREIMTKLRKARHQRHFRSYKIHDKLKEKKEEEHENWQQLNKEIREKDTAASKETQKKLTDTISERKKIEQEILANSEATKRALKQLEEENNMRQRRLYVLAQTKKYAMGLSKKERKKFLETIRQTHEEYFDGPEEHKRSKPQGASDEQAEETGPSPRMVRMRVSRKAFIPSTLNTIDAEMRRQLEMIEKNNERRRNLEQDVYTDTQLVNLSKGFAPELDYEAERQAGKRYRSDSAIVERIYAQANRSRKRRRKRRKKKKEGDQGDQEEKEEEDEESEEKRRR